MRDFDSNLIRAFIDGELPPETADEVREAMKSQPELVQRIEFERRMKAAIGHAMARGTAAPAALAESIRESLQSAASEEAVLRPAHAGERSGGMLAALAQAIDSLIRPRPLSVGAVLAVFAIAVGSVLFGIFYQPPTATLPTNGQSELISDPAQYVSQEHDRCVRDPEHMGRKVNFCDKLEAAVELMEHFGVESVTIFDLTAAGYEFIGEGRCNMPNSRRSAHLMYERHVEGKSPAKLSIFIAPAGEERPVKRCDAELTPGEWHKGTRCRNPVLLSTDDTLVYFLVTCDSNDIGPISELVGRALIARAN